MVSTEKQKQNCVPFGVILDETTTELAKTFFLLFPVTVIYSPCKDTVTL